MKKLILFPLLLFVGTGMGAEVDIDACESRILSDDGGLHCVIVNDPPPPPSGDITKMCLAGCSQTAAWNGDPDSDGNLFSDGYQQIYGDLFTSAAGFDGASLDLWLPGSSHAAYSLYAQRCTGDEDAVLLQVCIKESDTQPTDADLATVIDRVKIPGKPVYLMPLDVAGARSNLVTGPRTNTPCNFGDYDESVRLVDNAVADGLAERGPIFWPTYTRDETEDGCHPNGIGKARMSDTVKDWSDAL